MDEIFTDIDEIEERLTEEEIESLEKERLEAIVKKKKKIEREVIAFKKLIKVDRNPNSDSDMLKCSKCGKSMGIKKWARLVTKDNIVCPGCGAKYELGTKVKIVPKEKSRFKVENTEIDKNKFSVETRADGTRKIKETVNVKVKAVPTKK